ncbi:putative Ig domain-containing protein [Pyxidicoccus xibeiensis]|uniref:putative Ig domain-containing protein n=1 Tax=Pyxidicoccus xibeiensis TaxID=2906759 RepID=UPI0020A6EC9E|nr:putative Ig domain-containing protein [Pyxidicoccus xibeiensis]MCP3143073.1 putative Ig domain-containing protein [Pyxidicoccus xibeiensis]
MRFPRVLSLLLALLLTACPGSNPTPGTDAGSNPEDGGDSALTLSTDALPAATVASPYRASLSASGGSLPYSWHLVEGSLPAGLTLSSSGEITGTPSTSGSASFTLEVRDSRARSARGTFVIEVRGSGFQVTTSALPDAYLGTEYSVSLEASGGTAPYTWTLAGGALPSGLRLGANGRFTGPPVASGTFAVTVSVQDAAGLSAQRDLPLSVFAPPSLSSTPLALAVVGVPYSAALQATGGRGPLTFRINSGSLPAGLRLEEGAILGTPTTAGAASFTVEVQDRNDRAASASFQLSVRGGLTVTPTTLPDAYTDAAYGHALSAAGGQPPYTWALTQGPLPTGLSLLASGVLEGTSTTAGTSSFTVRVTDADGASDTREVTLATYAPPSVAAVPAQSVYVNDSVALPFTASSGRAPYVFTASGELPPSLTLAPEGLLHGRPSLAGGFAFDVIARDANGRTATRSVSITVHAPPAITSTTLPDGDLGQPYSQRLSSTGGRGTLTWSLASGSLPAGMGLSPNGTLSGTPSAAGTSSFTVRVADEGGRTDSRTWVLAVYGPPTITTSALPDGYSGSTYSASLTATGGRAPHTWSIASGSLPTGVTLTPSTGALSGTPGDNASTFSVTLRVTDSAGRGATRSLTLAVYVPLSLSGPGLELDGYVSEEFSARYFLTGGKPPYVFFTPGTRPAWLVLTSSGELFGTPHSVGTTSGQVSVSDANGRTATQPFVLTTYLLPTVVNTSHPEGRVGEAYSTQLSAAGGKALFTWSIASGALPTGLSLNAYTGRISGTPTSGSTSFEVRVSDANNRASVRAITLPIYAPPVVTTTSLPQATVGQPYSATLTASNGRAPLSWSHTGALPSGLSLSSTGVLSGTPTATGTSSFTVTVSDSESQSPPRTLSLFVSGAGALFTVGHWNIEWFGAPNQGPPSSTSDGGTPDDLQIAYARDILSSDAGVNVWGLVEMVDSNDFDTLKAQLPGYSGFLANDVAYVPDGDFWYGNGEQKPGILYDSTLTFLGAYLILTEAAFDFAGRPPLRVDFTVRAHGADENLTVIVVHMKAFEDLDAYGQRQRASAALKSYLDSQLPFERVLVIGDWNDDVDHSITESGGVPLVTPFESFLLDASDYTFITRPLSLAGERTTVNYPDAIDHTLATNEMAADYLPGSVRVLRPNTSPHNYGNTVSDHYPVISRYVLEGHLPGPSPAPHLFINEVLANEPSLDGGVGDSHYEFIEVVNAGSTSADLSGWSLRDSTAERHVFASGTTLAPGRAFVVFGGPRGFPAGTPNTVAASTGFLGLNNDGDTAYLHISDGGIADLVPYTTTEDNRSINRRPDAVPDAGFVPHTTLNPGLNASPGRRADGGAF